MSRRTCGWIAAIVIVGLGLGCASVSDVTDVPDDAILTLSPCAKTIQTQFHCLLVGTVKYESGDAAGANWTVDLFASGGSFGDGSVSQSVRLVTNSVGEVTATLIAPSDSMTIVVQLVGGGKSVADTIKVAKPAADTSKAATPNGGT